MSETIERIVIFKRSLTMSPLLQIAIAIFFSIVILLMVSGYTLFVFLEEIVQIASPEEL